MSEEKNEIQEVFSRKICDHDLLKFADNANRYNFQVGVTLICKGLMISGLVISGRTCTNQLQTFKQRFTQRG